MADSHPILTFQVGHYSNFIGTHWWNLQDASFEYDPKKASDVEVNHDVLYRQGNSPQGKTTYTPRLISFDLKGSLGTFAKQDNVPSPLNMLWDGLSECHQEEIVGKNPFLQQLETDVSKIPKDVNMESSVEVWTDFLKAELHPRSVCLLNDHFHNNQTEPFDVYTLGYSYWDKEDKREEIEDLIRWYVEDCDHLQGFNMIMDADIGFGGLGCRILQHLDDEYTRKARLVLPVLPAQSHYENGKFNRLINTGFVMDSLFEHASLFSPLSLDSSWASTSSRKFKHLQYQASLPYHSSAILATAIDSVTLPLRKKKGTAATLKDYERLFAHSGRTAVEVSCALPLPSAVVTSESLDSVLTELVPLTPGVRDVKSAKAQTLVWRGVQDVRKSQNTIDEWACQRWDQSFTTNTLFTQPCSGRIPYPRFFSDDGFEEDSDSPTQRSPIGLDRFSSMGGMHSSSSFGRSLRQLHTEVSRIKIKKLNRIMSLGVEEEDLLENRNRLSEYADVYEDDA